MSKMNNWMMDIEDFCDGYFYGGMNDFTIDEVVEDVGVYFMSNEAGKYAEKYLTTQMGEM
jgi:hypothetical protein